MRTRKLVVVLAIDLVLALLLYAPWPSSVTRQNFDRLRAGMTRDEVVAILGDWGDYRNADNDFALPPPREPADWFGRGSKTDWSAVWRGDEVELALGFAKCPDGQYVLANGICCRVRPKSTNPIVNMRWRADRRCNRWAA